jgi:hypothetical protein
MESKYGGSRRIYHFIGLFFKGFLQTSLVGVSTWLIANGYIWPLIFVSFMISLVWAFNVKSISFGGVIDKYVYALGAATGTIIGVLLIEQICIQLQLSA